MEQGKQREAASEIVRGRAAPWRKSEVLKMLKAARAGGQKVAECARERGVDVKRLQQWHVRLMATGELDRVSAPRSSAFLPVRVVTGTRAERDKGRPAVESRVEVVLRGGRVLRVGAGFDVETVRRLAAALEKSPC